VKEPLTLSETTRFASNRNTVFRPTGSHDFQIAGDSNRLEVYCNVPEEEYRKSVPNPYSRYGAIEDELEGKIPQKAGTVAP